MNYNELRNAIYEVLKYEDEVKNVLEYLSPSALELLDIIRDNEGVIKYDVLQEKFGKSYSTFRKYFNEITKNGLAYYFDDYVFIPKEIMKFLDYFVLEQEETMEFDDFMEYYLTIEQLKDICRRFELPVSGKKEKLIERITSSNMPPEEVLNVLYLDELKYIAEDMGLIKSGTKKEVINRILEHVSISKVKEFRVREEKVETQPKKAEIPKSKIETLWERLHRSIEQEFEMVVYRKDKEKDLERQLYQFLFGKFKDCKIAYQVHSKAGKIDLVVNNAIGIELKYKPTKTVLQRLIGQVDDYKEDYKKLIVVLAVDSSANMQTIHAYKTKLEAMGTRVVIKKV